MATVHEFVSDMRKSICLTIEALNSSGSSHQCLSRGLSGLKYWRVVGFRMNLVITNKTNNKQFNHHCFCSVFVCEKSSQKVKRSRYSNEQYDLSVHMFVYLPVCPFAETRLMKRVKEIVGLETLIRRGLRSLVTVVTINYNTHLHPHLCT